MAAFDRLPKVLKDWRGRRTQKAIARPVGISSQSLSSYENGRLWPPLPVLDKLLTVYEKSLRDLVAALDPEGAPAPTESNGDSLRMRELRAQEAAAYRDLVAHFRDPEERERRAIDALRHLDELRELADFAPGGKRYDPPPGKPEP